MLCGLLRLMSRLIPLVPLLRLLLLILLVPLLILLLMRGLLLSLMPRVILLLLRLMRGLLLSLMPRLMLRLPLIRRATFTVALAASTAIVASTSPAPPVASGFEASGQGMAAVGPVRAPIELLHANETDAKWVYTWKVDEHGWVVKAKSRLVASGFKQREGVDFSETFAPTVSSSCMGLLSAIACECDLDLCHFDADQAFVQSDLEEDVFLRLSKGCGDLSGKVVRVNKSLYGLKQTSRTWHAHLTTCLKRLGFEQCMTYVCVFRLIEDGRVAITAVVHVDVIFAVGQKERCDRLCVDLNQIIPVKNLGDSKWYGGCRYWRDHKRGTLTIPQQSFAEELVKKFRVTSVQSVPLKVGVRLEDFDEDEETESWPFHELLGGLMWLAISTRPDISNAVRSVARYCSAPKAVH